MENQGVSALLVELFRSIAQDVAIVVFMIFVGERLVQFL